jgi:carboxyl-terminal processing protease
MSQEERKKKNKIWKSFLRIFLALIIAFFVFSLGAYLGVHDDVVKEFARKEVLYMGKLKGKYDTQNNEWTQNVNFELYWDTWDLIRDNYVGSEEISDKEMFYGSLRGLVSSLDDPYTEFMDPSDFKNFQDDMSSSFEGIGVEIGIRDDILTVISPLDGTPAFDAGIIAGDKIIEIDGESTKNMNINEAVSRIRGPKGSEVVLSIFREGLEEIQEISIIRETIIIESLEYEEVEDGVFSIKITSFNDDTEYLFFEAVKDIMSLDPQGIILDLRNNPGGYLDASVSILGEWIDGEVAVIEKFGPEHLVDYKARGLNRLSDISTVVLINRGSASASEIIAGALRDHNKAYIIGRKSYGKGSIQMINNLREGSAVKITVAEWLTPNGQNINEEGIEPDEVVENTLDDYLEGKDLKMEAAIEFFK